MGETDRITEQQKQYEDLFPEDIDTYLRHILDTSEKAFMKVKGDGDPAYISGHSTIDMERDIFLVLVERNRETPPSIKIAIDRRYLHGVRANIRITVNNVKELIIYTMDGQTKIRRYIKDEEGVFRVFVD